MTSIKLTPYQLTFYYEWLSNPHRYDYNMVIDNTVTGQIDIQRFNDSFKTTFNECFIFCHNVSNQSDGVFWKQREPAITSEIITYHDTALTDDEIRALVLEPFDLENGVLGRAHVINCGNNQYRLILIFHHIAIDGISTEEAWDTFRQHYNGVEHQSPLMNTQVIMHEELNNYFDELLVSQKEQMTSFWKEHLNNVQNIDLTFLKPHTVIKNKVPFSITEYTFSYNEEITKQVKSLRRRYKITTYLFGQLVMAILLHKITRQADIPLMYPVAILEGKELLYGAHVNTLPINYHFDDQTSLQTLIDKMLAYYKDVKNHHAKYLPIYDIIPYADNPAILDIAFVQTFFRDHQTSLNGISNEQIKHDFQVDLSNKLVFEQEEHNNKINYRVKFDATVLDKELVQQLTNFYQQLFTSILNYLLNDQADTLTKTIKITDDNLYQALIHDKNQTRRPYEHDKTIHQLFEIQAAKTPLNAAVLFNDIQLSYAQLNGQANQLAHYLQKNCSIKPNDFVGLYLDRSEQIVVGVLAALKSGAAYVPMDPDAPDERNAFIMKDAQLKAIICQAAYAKKLAELAPDTLIIAVDEPSLVQTLLSYPVDNVVSQTTPRDLAYAIYTSGTTGNPKGTLIEHHNVNRLIVNANYVEIDESDRFLSISGYQFDASTYDMFGPLLNGAAVVIATKDNFLNLAVFNQLLEDYKVTNFFATAAFFNTLVDAELPNLARLRYALAGGEALSAAHVNRFIELYPQVKLVNGYGPTETTTFAVTYLTNQAAPFDHSVPIGVALSNTSLYILNELLEPVPMGAIGELYIGGAGVGRGYLNNPELTRKVFIANPFQTPEEKAEGYNDRLYKTGDLVRYLPDGNIEYIGRNDFQVKIRGFRIELSEIENRLVSHPQIKQSAVLALVNGSGGKYLAAYYVADKAIEQEALIAYLQQFLPEYMLPAAFVHLTAFPLNMNGKLDRRALPAPTFSHHASFVSPQTPVEQKLRDIFSVFLGITADEISILDDFFQLGGNSIVAIKLASNIAKTFDKKIHVADIFTKRTIQALAKLIEESKDTSHLICATPVDKPEDQLLSFAQERLWFIDSYEGGTSAYNIPLVFKLTHTANSHSLQQALLHIIDRHEVLRSHIKMNQEGMGYQEPIDIKAVSLSFNQLVCHSITELNNRIATHSHHVFTLDQEIPVSITCYQLNDERYISIVIHHIAFDGWSIDLLTKELLHYYAQYQAKHLDNQHTITELPAVEVQYKDFALWQRQFLQGTLLEQQLTYWQQQLAGYESLNLPTDYPRPSQIDYQGRDIHFQLGTILSQNLRKLATELNVSLYTVLLSGYYLLLNAFSNQKDIVIGTPTAGRHYQGIENTIGFFVNSLVLRQSIKSDTRLIEFIKQTGEQITRAQQHQDIPFEKLVEAMHIEKDESRHPLFQVMFGVQSFGNPHHETLTNLLELYQTPQTAYQVAKFDITTLLDDSEESISGVFNYATRLFKDSTIEHYISVYKTILVQFTNLCEQQQPLSEIRLLNTLAYQALIHDKNQTRRPYEHDKTIHQLFEIQAAKTPLNTAVLFDDVALSYAQLNGQANQLAHYLQKNCTIRPNDFVGLYLDRSEQIVVGVLAALKSGAAYVPMDPDAPDERNAFIMKDAQLKAIICQAAYAKKLAELAPDTLIIAVDEPSLVQTLLSYPVDNVVSQTTPRDLAYAIYTSGTTGNPKGTLIEHHNVNRLIVNANYVEIDESDRFLSISGYQFDASTYDMFGPLLNGAAVVIATKDNFLNLAVFNQLLEDYKVTNFFATAAFFNTLVDAELPNLARLRYALAGGEALSAAHVNRFIELYPQVKLVNGYGPTETTTFAVTYLTNQAAPFDHSVPIGVALSNTSLYILNELLEPVPMGAIGELYIGSAGVGRGYLNNPELTRKVFIANPFQTPEEKAEGYNDRLYKTGDLVRYLPDGNIEYIGRNDFQVKIRGFRIELSEIENRLVSHPQIKQSAVLALANGSGGKYLAAYYVADKAIEQEALITYLQQFLPEYMLPAAFVHLTAFPLNMNGKLDRRALPEPELTNTASYIAPSNPTETIFCQLFANILRLDEKQVGIEDDFFKLGGDSISSIQLANRIRQHLGFYLSIKDIFNYRTVKGLSDYVIKHQDAMTAQIQSEQGILEGELALSPIQHWFFNHVAQGQYAAPAHWNQAFLIKVPPLDLGILKLSIAKLIEYHDMLRTTYTPTATYYQTSLPLAFDQLNVAALSTHDIENQLTHWQNQFNLAQGPLYHIGYLEGYADNSARIHFAAHHLNIDAVSWRIIKQDLQAIYEYFSQQSSLDENISAEKILGLKGTSYRQWVAAQKADHSEQAYWQEVLTNFTAYQTHINQYRVDTAHKLSLTLPKEQTSRLLREANRVYHTTINDLLLTVLTNTLSHVFETSEHYVLLEGHGREKIFDDIDVNNTVGWFTCMYPVKLSMQPSSTQTLIHVKDNLRNIPQHGLGYGMTMGYTAHPLPAICFNYLGQFDGKEEDKQWAFSHESTGIAISPKNRMTDLLSLNGGVLNGQLQFNVEAYLNTEQLQAFNHIFNQQLSELLSQLASIHRSYLTASDIDYLISNDLLNKLQESQEIEAIYPANSLQQGFIYHAVAQGQSDSAYRIQLIWEYHNPMNEQAFKKAWAISQANYPALRLRFSWDEEFTQIVDKQSSFQWEFIDLSHQQGTQQQQSLDDIIKRDHRISYDLTEGKLFRIYLIKLADKHYQCLFNNHHAILDGWSIPVLLNNVHQNYLALLNNKPVIEQIDHCYLETQAFLQEKASDTEAFWKNYLSSPIEPESLESLLKEEVRHINLSEHKFISDHQELSIDFTGKQAEKLKALCRQYDFTINALMQYCWHQQLSIYGNTKTTTVGMTVSGRNLPIDGIETSVGLYINTLPVIFNHENGLAIDSIKQLQSHINNVNNHSNINLIKLQRSGNRLFNSLFVFENYPISDIHDEQIKFTFKEGKERLDYPLAVVAFENAEQISLKIKYAGELFNHSAIERVLQGINLTLEQLITEPMIKVNELQLLTPDEFHHIVQKQSQVVIPFAKHKLVNQLFEEQVQNNPNAYALVYENVRFTYQELNDYSNKLAHYLINTLSIKPDDLIGLYLDKSEHMAIAILATLKAGAAYVPMSPEAPTERVQHMVSDTNAKAILTNASYQDYLNQLTNHSTPIIALDKPAFISEIAHGNNQNPITQTQSHNLAYIIYTSGTTGNPKGVMIEHHSLINMVSLQQDLLDLNLKYGQKNVLWYASYVFDAHAFELYNSLLNGHCVHILAESKRLNFNALSLYIKDQRIDLAFIPPALLDKNELLTIPTLTIGGESANAEVVNQYCQQNTRLINLYGPTETTIWATSHIYQKGDNSNNIGKANPNFYLYILDEHLRPVPQGVKGELYIGGFGVGRGYLNNAELTNRTFISNPFQTQSEKERGYNERLYKTGDVVRYLPNGDVEYIGRNDFQVKIRGFRIELGEIEARLASHPEIKQTLVIPLSNSLGTKYLAAYYVAEQALSQESLTDYLQQFLPDYMLPSAFVHLTAMPININGKIDRKALPEPSFTAVDTYVAPSTSTEERVVKLFADLLGVNVEQIGIHNDFFGLGGDSILAIKLSSQISKLFNKTVPIGEIFNKRNVQALAKLIDELKEGQQQIIAPAITKPEEQRLSFAQERLWFIDSYENGSNAYNIPLVFKLTENADYNTVIQALTMIIERHEVLRSLIKTNADGLGYLAITHPQETPLHINHQHCDSKIILDNALYNHAHKIFVLDQELPISIHSYLLNQTYYISLVIHHIVFDGWSTDLLIKELIACYQKITLQTTHPLPTVEVQYKDFALWQRHYLQGDVLNQQLDYWQQQLGDYEPLNLPTDYPRPAQVSYEGADVSFELDEELSQALRGIAAKSKVSLYSVLLSGFYLLLSGFSHQRDIVIGSPIAGRHHQGIENTIGFFVNMLAIRQSIKPEDTLKAFIEQTSTQVLEAQKHQDLPFEKLVETLRVEKDPSRHPIFQVMFGVQSFAKPNTLGVETLFEPYQTPHMRYHPAKFDITTLLDDSQPAISGIFNYATRLFNEQTIQHYISVYQHILKQMVLNYEPQNAIAELQFLTPETYQKTILQWNQTRCDYPTDVNIAMLFEQQVEKTPANIAVVYEKEHLTYQRLNEQANKLAHYLRSHFAIAPDDLVALCLERSTYMPISILAILKAGGAYVPMDPQAPDDRIAYMLADTKAKVVLTTHQSYEKIKALVNPEQRVINLQDEDNLAAISHYPHHNLPHVALPHHLAYVIYTSGTTGNPKGVMLEHQGVVNRINWMHKEYPITEHDHILQKTNYTFDVSVWELFWANWYGACIVFANSELYKDNVYLAELIESEHITVLHFVPSMLVAFIETLESQPALQSKVQSLKYIFCSGEALNLYEVKKCQQLLPTCEIHNLYGPTEATVDVLYYDCNDPTIKQVLIGKPIDNTSAYILNDQLQPVPIGGIGELYVGGDGVARGYLNNPSLTQERFIRNPFQTLQEQQQHYNSRIYKTGDLVRALADGNIQYLGRNDFQVKIRGFRIELGEIEARLTLYPEINHSVVIAYEQASGSKYLVAYYVAATAIDEQDLVHHLQETLPSYMIPSTFIHLCELPITSNGKLNRKALPKPELTDKVEYIAPENATEIKLCEIFAHILKISATEISMADNFFKLGGNSILAMMLNNRINETFHTKLRLVDILNTQTIRELAKVINNTQQQFNPVVPLNNAINKPIMLMIHPGIGGCDVYTSLANKLANYYQCHGIDSYNFYHDDKIDDLPTLTHYYLNHIQNRLPLNEPIVLLGWSLGGQIALEMATYLEAIGAKDIKVYLLDTWLLNEEDLQATQNPAELTYAMKELNIPDSLKTKVETLAAIDNKLVVQPLSSILKTTQVILFKAMQAKENAPELYEKYPYNNIDHYLSTSEQMQVIELACDHYKIIKQEQAIINHVLALVN